MKAMKTAIDGVLIIEPDVFSDGRGHFFESFSQKEFDKAAGSPITFVQDNQSRSARGVLRGLHYQASPFEQGKLVRVAAGTAFDVAVDIRMNSPTFGEWIGVELSSANHRQLWIPGGLAHGFLAISDGVELLYKTTSYYMPEAERSIRWNDASLSIAWPLPAGAAPIVSNKDAAAPTLREALGLP